MIKGTVKENERGDRLKPENQDKITPPMVVQNTGHMLRTETGDNNTALSLVGVLMTCFGRINIINYIY